MEGLNLLDRAREVGLSVRAEDGQLVVVGPRRHEALASALLAHKAEVLAELELEARLGAAWEDGVLLTPDLFKVRTLDDLLVLWERDGPPARCFACGSTRWWHLRPTRRLPKGGSWICARCHPPLPSDAEIEWANQEGAG